MATVLWGKRRGDVQYGSRDFWRRNIPIGSLLLSVDHTHYFDVGDLLDVSNEGSTLRILGIERGRFGVERVY